MEAPKKSEKRRFIDALIITFFTPATFQTFFSISAWRFAMGELPSIRSEQGDRQIASGELFAPVTAR
ncbi:hypothetical protein FGE05_25620 [Pseudomonas sp. ICMP22404]|uniref:hypothetical protein n=1 Tax=Pseudomonas sp. ICMP22404 TaxID=2583807 RepID=UPI0011198A2B|nr:hypothetical protein [Pseudomonas sp. ICMP22404]TNF79237.1 hypothetical protein FGE05_25620 [Pseudomonas sp. ICMP22404]